MVNVFYIGDKKMVSEDNLIEYCRIIGVLK